MDDIYSSQDLIAIKKDQKQRIKEAHRKMFGGFKLDKFEVAVFILTVIAATVFWNIITYYEAVKY